MNEPGERFQSFYRDHKDTPPAVKAAFFGVAITCFAAGVVFAFIPGPGVLFFALGGALLATQSLWIARRFDAIESWGRRTIDSIRERWRRRQTRAGVKHK